MSLRTVRLWLWGAVAAAAGILVGVAWSLPPTEQRSTVISSPDIGGEFALIDEDGKPRR